MRSTLVWLSPPLGALAFAASGPAAVVALRDFPVQFVIFCRCAIAAILLSAFLRRRVLSMWSALPRSAFLLACASGTALAFHFTLFLLGLKSTSFPVAMGLVALEPITILAAAAVFFGIRPTRGQTAGVSVALIGAAVISLVEHRPSQGPPHSTSGDLILGAAVVLYGCYYAANRALLGSINGKGDWRNDAVLATTVYAVAGVVFGRDPSCSGVPRTGRLCEGVHLARVNYAFIVTKAEKASQLRRAIQEGRRNERLLTADFPREMLTTAHDDELAEVLGRTQEDAIEYLGAVFYGPASDVNVVCKRFSLWS